MRKPFETVCVVGLGYIGLPTAAVLATKGFRVFGVDVEPTVVAALEQGDSRISEPDLDVLVRSAVQSGRLRAGREPRPADVFIIAVPTPLRDAGTPDLSCVEAAVESVAPHLVAGNLLVLESTCPVGTTEKVAVRLRELRSDLLIPLLGEKPPAAEKKDTARKEKPGDREQLFIAHCPERVLPGRILKELLDNDRVVGGLDRAAAEQARELYRSFVHGRILLTDARTAEACKLAENAFRDVNIAFANELSLICDELGLDVWKLIELANRHPRVNILRPGPGVGGHCIAVDPWFLVNSAPATARLMRTAREVNDGKPERVAAEVKRKCAGLKNPVIVCLGLAFKAEVADTRESPAVRVVELLATSGVGRVLAVEPHVTELPGRLREAGVEQTGLEEGAARADLLVLLTDHEEFRALSPEVLRDKVVVDTRGFFRRGE